MISSSKDKVGSSSSTKQEEINNTSSSTKDGKNNTTTTNVKASSSISTSSPWLRLKDPRIVRVSRAFGGKDRHSKVCTIRGLRDRRVRLSVPTAIELYDLQDRLGLNQPSKVVDWLLNAAKDEIDELPPLPIPPGSFPHLMTHQAMLSAGNNNTLSSCSKQEFKNMMNNSTTSTASINWEENGDNNARFWNSKGVGGGRDHQDVGNEKEKWMSCTKRDHDHQEEDKQEMISNEAANSSSSFLNRSGGLNFPYGTSFFPLESQNFNPLLSSSSPHHHIGSSSSGHHVVPFPSPLSLSSTTYFPNSANSSMEIDARQIGHFQMLTNSSPTPYSIAQSMRPFHFSMSQPADNHHKDSHDQEFDQN